MTNWTADIYDTLAAGMAALESIDDSIDVEFAIMKDGGIQKVLVAQGSTKTKSFAAVDAWAAVAQNAIRKGATVVLSSYQKAILYIDVALTSEVAHTGTEIIVQTSSSDVDDEFWSNFTSIIGPSGTSNTEPITNNPLEAGGTSITCIDTTGYATKASWRFILDAVIANSELVFQTDLLANTHITILNGTKRAHVQTTPMWSISETIQIQIPAEAERVRVLYNNTYDSDGASIATRCRVSKISGL